MTSPPKYRLVKGYTSDGFNVFMKQVNTLVDEGYKVHTFTTEYEEGEHRGIGDRRLIAFMSLSSSSKYDDIVNLRDVDPRDVEEYLLDGWVVADSWAKNIRMVKKAVKT